MPYLTTQFGPSAWGRTIALELDSIRNNNKTYFSPGDRCWIRAFPAGQGLSLWTNIGSALLVGTLCPETVEEEFVVFNHAQKASASKPISEIISYSWLGRSDDSGGHAQIDEWAIKFPVEISGILKLNYKFFFDRILLVCNQEGQVMVQAQADDRYGYIIVPYSVQTRRCFLTVRDACSQTIISGTQVRINGNYVGRTDEQGRIALGELSVGSHSLRMSKSGYQNSEDDNIANDEFSIPGSPTSNEEEETAASTGGSS